MTKKQDLRAWFEDENGPGSMTKQAWRPDGIPDHSQCLDNGVVPTNPIASKVCVPIQDGGQSSIAPNHQKTKSQFIPIERERFASGWPYVAGKPLTSLVRCNWPFGWWERGERGLHLPCVLWIFAIARRGASSTSCCAWERIMRRLTVTIDRPATKFVLVYSLRARRSLFPGYFASVEVNKQLCTVIGVNIKNCICDRVGHTFAVCTHNLGTY